MSFKSDTIFVSGLDSIIGEEEIRNEIFQDCGVILSVSVAHDRNGKSLGQVSVRFQTSAMALKAQKEFDGAKVDGRSMSVQLIGTPVQPIAVIKAPAPKKAAIVKKTPESKPAPKQQRAAAQQPRVIHVPVPVPVPARRSPAPRSAGAATTRPVAQRAQAQPRGTKKPAAIPSPASKAKKAPAQAAKKPAAPAGKKPVAKKPAAKKAPVKKSMSLADLDAQMDSYNAKREAKAE